MAAAFKFSGIAAANQTETKVVITDNTVMLSLHFLKVDEDKNEKSVIPAFYLM